jgi:hypothetical protein
MGNIPMVQLCDEHAAMTPAFLPSTIVLADVRGGFGATGASTASGVITGQARVRFVEKSARITGEVSDWLVERDVPSYPNSIFAGGVRCSLPSGPPV